MSPGSRKHKALKSEGVCLSVQERKLIRFNKAQEREGEEEGSRSCKALVIAKVWGVLSG